MKILAIDTSSRIGSVAALADENLIGQIQLNVEATHTERLLPAISIFLKQIGWNFSDITGLALAIGPGSFTGLRIGLATAKGFAQGSDLPIVGISSLLALAHNAHDSVVPVVALMDAKRKEVYAAVYQFKNGTVQKTLLEEQAIAPYDLSTALKKIGDCLLLGDGALAYQEFFREQLGSHAHFSHPLALRPEAKWIAWLAKPLLEKGEGKDWENLTPNYLRLSDAKHG